MSSLINRRQNIHLLDLRHSTFRLNKFLLFLRLVGKRRGIPFFILRPDACSLAPDIISRKAAFAPQWLGGVLTNYTYVGQFFIRNIHLPFHYTLYPSAVLTFPNNKALNEARRTRTPCAFLADSSSNVFLAPYGINGNPDYFAFKALVELSLSSLDYGRRAEKLSFARVIKLAFKFRKKRKKN